MKKILIIMVVGLLGFMGCKDEALAPIITFDQAGKGAYVRRIAETGSKLVNLLDINASKYGFSVELVDEQKGALISEYNINVTFSDKNPDIAGNKTSGPKLWKSYKAADFKDSKNGYKSVEGIEFTGPALLAFFGLAVSDVGPGDVFELKGSVVLTDGQVFTHDNSSAAVRGSAFAGHFNQDLTANCPSTLAGTYDYVGSAYFCGGGATGKIKIVAAGGGSFNFDDWSFGSYPKCYGGLAANWGTLRFKEVCGKVSFTGFTDNYGDTWTFTSTVSGKDWTITYLNTYGEFGTAVIKHPTAWPFTL